jgi:hypothetical protein
VSLALLALAACQACANNDPPPGGPPDTAPPQLLAVRPESGAVVPRLDGAAVVKFDEVIEEMAGAGGGIGSDGLARYVLLSPVRGDVKVSWARSEIHVRPREGWKQGRVYRLELRPGIADLRRNVLKEGKVILFSTGPAIPNAQLSGTVVQWVEQRPGPEALVLAQLLPDTIAYKTTADSTGAFRLDGIPPGRYKVYGVIDQNRNGVRDRREAFDTAFVTVDATVETVLWAFVHDTVGPRVRSAEFVDSITARVTFNQALDPSSALDTARVHVLALPDTTPVAVRTVMSAVAYDSLAARERAAADSSRRAAADTGARADTSRAARDTTRRPVPARPGAPPPTRIAVGPPPTAEGDTTALRTLLRRRPVPADRVVLRFVSPLRPGSKYLVRVRGARNLSGAAADGQAVIAVPVPPQAPRDSTAPPARP